jgi:hypothetical protein
MEFLRFDCRDALHPLPSTRSFRLRGRYSDDIDSLLGHACGDEVVHRNDLVLL